MLLFRDEHAQATLAQPALGRLSGGLAVFVPAPLSRGMQRSMLHVCYIDQGVSSFLSSLPICHVCQGGCVLHSPC